jgi:chemosensory pili system protein ChpA (sensor histidine kinase/response regulator)
MVATENLPLSDIDLDLVQVFFEEAEEISEDLEASILSWSQETENRIHMENMLRGLHTLKGGARLCGLSKLGDSAHDFESIVIEVQGEERDVDDALFMLLHQRYDDIVGRLSAIKEAVSNPQPSAADPIEHADSPPTGAISAPPDASDPGENAVESAPLPAERSHQEMVRVGSALLEELVNLAGENSILRARIEQGMSDFTGALDEMEITIERLREQLRRLEIETETQILFRHERTEGPEYENFDPLEMDRYSHLQQLSRGLSESASDMLDLKDTLLHT